MLTLAEKISARHAPHVDAGLNSGYWCNWEHMPEVLALLNEYCATGQYPYNSNVIRFISEREGIGPEMEGWVSRELYLANQQREKDNQRAEIEEQIAAGWQRMTSEVCDSLTPGTRIIFKSRASSEPVHCRVIAGADGKPFILPGRKRNRGYNASSFAFGGAGVSGLFGTSYAPSFYKETTC